MDAIIKQQASVFSAIIENANESIWLLSPELKVLQYNKTARERMYLTRGKEIYLGADFKEFLHRDTKDVFMPMFNAAATGTYVEQESYQEDIHGNMFWLRTKMYPVYDPQQQLLGVAVLAENITDRKKTAKELEQSEQRNRALIENISDTIILINANLEVVYQSPSFVRTSGFSLEDLKGKTVLDVLHPEDLKEGYNIVAQATASPKTLIPFQLRTLTKAGGYIWIEGTATNLLDDPAVQAFVLNYRNITERKIMDVERQQIVDDMLQRNRDLEQFAYIVSHNLRAPVANILGFSTVLLNHHLTEDLRNEIIGDLVTSGNQLDNVIKDLNQILQLRNDISEQKEVVQFGKIVGDIKTSLGKMLEREDAEIVANFLRVPEMFSVRSHIYSIFYNLIANGIKYRKPGVPAVVEITSYKEDNDITIVIKDNGLGIDLAKNKDLLFGLYRRFHTHVEGRGVSLFMVKTQVEMLGGTITVESEVNKGASFTIRFSNITEK